MKKTKKIHTAFVDMGKVSAQEFGKFFTDRELDVANKFSAEKKADWLAGRIAAKKVLRELLAIEKGLDVVFCEIEIVSRKFQKPTFLLKGVDAESLPVIDLAISHSAGVGLAAASVVKKEGLVGVDLEKVRVFSEELRKNFLTKAELNFLAQIEAEKLNQIATMFWCAKEACLKAKGVGLLQHPQTLEVCLAADRKGGIVREKASWQEFAFSCETRKPNFVAVALNIK